MNKNIFVTKINIFPLGYLKQNSEMRNIPLAALYHLVQRKK
jgi:hypothetical protein